MEIELCDEDEHAEKACAKARDEPNANPVLEPPKYSSFSMTVQWGRLKMADS